MFRYGHYIQAINYPTVARGEEKLRLAPTPFHNIDMMNQLVNDMKTVWAMLDMQLIKNEETYEPASKNNLNIVI